MKTTQITAPVLIQDVVVAGVLAPLPPRCPTGEFHSSIVDNEGEDPGQMLDRLLKTIDGFVTQASTQHRLANCGIGNELKPGCENNITRLITNEFFFYTKQPLSIPEFEALVQTITDLAKTQPENLHLVLASFAVRTPDNKVMNVVPQIQCGHDPIINLTVKNNPSTIDPVYKSKDPHGFVTLLPNVAVIKDKVADLAIKIDDRDHHFSFNCAMKCNTAGGAEFNSCIDICLDHALGVGKDNLNKMIVKLISEGGLERLPTQCSHIVVSNTVGIIPAHCVGGLTHADPDHSHKDSKPGVAKVDVRDVDTSEFGTIASAIITAQAPCGSLPQEQLAVLDIYHQYLDAISAIPQEEFHASAAILALEYYNALYTDHNDQINSVKQQAKNQLADSREAIENMIVSSNLSPKNESACTNLKRDLYDNVYLEWPNHVSAAENNLAQEWKRVIQVAVISAKEELHHYLITTAIPSTQEYEIAKQAITNNMIDKIRAHMVSYQKQQMDSLINVMSQSTQRADVEILTEISKLRSQEEQERRSNLASGVLAASIYPDPFAAGPQLSPPPSAFDSNSNDFQQQDLSEQSAANEHLGRAESQSQSQQTISDSNVIEKIPSSSARRSTVYRSPDNKTYQAFDQRPRDISASDLRDILKRIGNLVNDKEYWKEKVKTFGIPTGVKAIKKYMNNLDLDNMPDANLKATLNKINTLTEKRGEKPGLLSSRHHDTTEFYSAVRTAARSDFNMLNTVLDKYETTNQNSIKLKK